MKLAKLTGAYERSFDEGLAVITAQRDSIRQDIAKLVEAWGGPRAGEKETFEFYFSCVGRSPRIESAQVLMRAART